MVPPFLFFLATVGLHLCPVGKRDCCPSPHGLVLLIPSIRTSSGMLSPICSTVPSISHDYPRKEPVKSYNSSCVCSSLGVLCFHSDPQSAFVSLLTNFTVTYSFCSHYTFIEHLLHTKYEARIKGFTISNNNSKIEASNYSTSFSHCYLHIRAFMPLGVSNQHPR